MTALLECLDPVILQLFGFCLQLCSCILLLLKLHVSKGSWPMYRVADFCSEELILAFRVIH